MTLYETIENDIKTALKAGDTARRSVLTVLKAAVKNKALEARLDKAAMPEDALVEEVARTEVKKRRDAAGQYRTGGRGDMALQEEREISVLMAYLPPQMTEIEIEALVREIIPAVALTGEKDFGKVMAQVTQKTKGKADGTLVAQIVKRQIMAYNESAR